MFSFSNKNQKIAVIGSGYWGSIIIKTLIELGFKNIIIYDKSVKNKNIAKKKFKIVKFENIFSNILKDNNILNTFVVTPPSQNLKIVTKLINNNKNIFLEKPGFDKINDLKKIEKYLKKSNSKLIFGYIYCYNEYIKKIKTILDRKILGEIQYISFSRKNLGPIRSDVDVDYDLTSHDLSIIKKLFNKLPKIKSSEKYSLLKKNISDISNLHLTLGNINIDINNSWLNPTKERLIKIIGKKKMLSFDEMNLDAPIQIYNQYAKYPDLDFFDKGFLNSKALIYKGKSKSIKLNVTAPLINEIKSFFNTKKPLTDIKFAKDILTFLEQI
ncbi:Gfo/Idh/MocA family oxidoreductase [Candidatus Pelagibacter sp.]|nr:Gfo/Idh/MocA family oxidoreductase [Candidatus Pelagibacter sp.]